MSTRRDKLCENEWGKGSCLPSSIEKWLKERATLSGLFFNAQFDMA